ncbi:ABC transporter substrate-binding protein [Mesorhizobium sp.]|uniref:ABC transporter substrate-binding protein n=1 Tax=Mesorhizobium sp. TaxID=1871066 RepID=UPI000FE54F79|nr:ABC transporter substrate-binding protein [Mesorhizobium sp.]RWA79243.1 MAG: ABC transporter substrate-binding protein [Mesorhizobium sp.]
MKNVSSFSGLISNRREFLQLGAALGLTCVTPVNAAVAEERPKKGGKLNLALLGGSSSDSLDPAKFNDIVVRVIGYAVCNQLVELTSDNKLIPELAVSWETADNVKWTIKLRNDVTFHNGKPFDATDVLYSLNMHMGSDTKSGAKAMFEEVDHVGQVDLHTVEVTLKSPNADFIYVFADYHVMIVPNGFAAFTSLIGTGGYELVSFEPGLRATLKRNTNYWKTDRAHVELVEIAVINDATARSAALRAGSADIINAVNPKLINMMKNVPGFEVVRAPAGYYPTFVARSDLEPTSDNNIRLALKYAIDREQLLKLSVGGYGVVANDQPIPPTNPYFNPNIEQTQYDPERSKFFLKKAGLTKLRIELFTSETVCAGAIDMATLYSQQARNSNIDIQVERRPADGYWSDIWMKKQFFMGAWINRPADQTFSLIFKSGVPWNEGYWKNERFDSLLSSAKAELNFEKRKELYGQMQVMLAQQGPSIIPLFIDNLDAKGPRVRGFEPSAVEALSGSRVIERVWLV